MVTSYVRDGDNLVAQRGDVGFSLNSEFKYRPVRAVITSDMHKYTIELLDQAAKLAESVRKPIKSSSNSDGVQSSPPSSQRNKYSFRLLFNDTALRVAAFIGGVFALIGGAYLMGKFTAKNETLDREIGQFEKLAKRWDCCHDQYAYDSEYEETVTKIVELTRGIMKRDRSDLFALNYKVALPIILSAGLLVTGGVFSSIPLISVGALGVVGVGGYAVYKAVKNANSDADKIFENIDKLKKTELYDETCDFFNVRMKYGTLG